MFYFLFFFYSFCFSIKSPTLQTYIYIYTIYIHMALTQISCDCFNPFAEFWPNPKTDNATNYQKRIEMILKHRYNLFIRSLLPFRNDFDILLCDIFVPCSPRLHPCINFKLTKQSNRFSNQLLPNPSLHLFIHSFTSYSSCMHSSLFYV